MELTAARNFEGDRWKLDKLQRWRSTYWRRWVASSYTGPIPEDAGPADMIIAAHMRYPGCGIATKPADCLIYAMPDADHKHAHNTGQDTLENQWRKVTATMVRGLDQRVLLADHCADSWIRSQDLIASSGNADLSTDSLEFVASHWARLFMTESLWFNDFNTGPIPW